MPAGAVLELPYYGYITALAIDPIEKKPLYHWRPGSSIASIGFAGCNLRCPFCQNWHISQVGGTGTPAPAARLRLNPEELVAAVMAVYAESGTAKHPEHYEPESRQIAYTYSEPLVHAEYLTGCMAEARKENIANILVTNGCVNAETAEAVLGLADAANIDLKCFSEKTYTNILGGKLHAVLDFIRLAVARGVHTEITTLVVPGLNDSERELAEIAEFIAGLSGEIAWHLSAYHPDWKWNVPPTNPAKLSAAAEQARAILPHVYAGNIAGEQNDTHCRHCGSLLVQRVGYRVNTPCLAREEQAETTEKAAFYRCTSCGKPAPIRWK
jgi:pyruvate formate lyase activating enzyme